MQMKPKKKLQWQQILYNDYQNQKQVLIYHGQVIL